MHAHVVHANAEGMRSSNQGPPHQPFEFVNQKHMMNDRPTAIGKTAASTQTTQHGTTQHP
jgi:hypothetical protein